MNQLGVLKVSGADAQTFLQGQLTNDLTALDSGWQYNALCTPKGRALALFITWRVGEVFYLATEQSLIESAGKRLSMYVLRSKVVIEAAPELVLQVSSDRGLGLFEKQQDEHGNIYLGLGSAALEISTQTPEASEVQSWQDVLIDAGLPMIGTENLEEFVPQMLNLDVVNGISFKKGCYTGQEIVARMHYLGKLKQRMFVVTGENADQFQAGQKLLDARQKTIGRFVLCNQAKALAVLRLDHLAKQEAVYAEDGSAVSLLSQQPYALPGADGDD